MSTINISRKILAIIPARGGSKGVPGKNIRLLCGKPLIAYAIEAALATSDIFRVIVTTDDPTIADVAKAYNADVPFLRPASLAEDRTPMVPVLQHATSFVEAQDGVHLDWVLLLQPTAVFRTSEDIKAAIRLGQESKCDSVISVVQVFAEHPILMKRIEGGRLLPYCIEEKEGTRRQDYSPSAYMRNGAIYLTRRDVLMARGSLWGAAIAPYIMPADRSVNIDSELDLKLAEILMRERINS